MIKDLEAKNKIGIFSVGTAGHVMPSVRIINELKEQGFDSNNLLVVTGNRNEKKYYRKVNVDVIEYNFIRTNKSTVYYLINFVVIFKSLYFLNQIICKNNISVIFTTGSYIAPLISFLGYIKNIPVYLQEQNIFAGLGNYIGSIFAKKVYTSFPNTNNLYKKKIDYVGPVLDHSIETNKSIIISNMNNRYTKGDIAIGVQGGSQGSQEINELVFQTFQDWNNELLPIKLIHITGGLSVQDIDNQLIDYSKVEFIDDMKSYYDSISLQITRGGGGILESAFLGIINIIVPYKYGTTSKHQERNALYLSDRNAAYMLEGPNFSKAYKTNSEKLKEIIRYHEYYHSSGKQILNRTVAKSRGGSYPYKHNTYEFCKSEDAYQSVKPGARKLIANELYDEYRKSI